METLLNIKKVEIKKKKNNVSLRKGTVASPLTPLSWTLMQSKLWNKNLVPAAVLGLARAGRATGASRIKCPEAGEAQWLRTLLLS